MKVAVVGSREFPQLQLVEWFIKDLPQGVTVISGGAKGVDTCAATVARQCGLETEEVLPELKGCKERHEFTERYYARNQRLVDSAHLVVAFTEKERGGTWDTIKRARKAGKPVKIIRPCSFFDRGPDKADVPAETTGPAEGREVGKGPFHIKRVGLGSFALKLKRYLETTEWADFITGKDAKPEELGRKMLPDFITFFESHGLFGKIHAITQAPKSVRNLKRKHPMDVVCKGVAARFGLPYVEMFKPWDKKRRGRFAAHPDIEITPAVKDYVGKVVYVLDDVVTTGYTLQACVRCLTALEIHTHATAFIMYG
jgi:phosphoribosylpyrophosphate synthetase